MAGITHLDTLLRQMNPVLVPGEFVFCTVNGPLADCVSLAPQATFLEAEGLTLVLAKATADGAGLAYEGVFRQISLQVHSSLAAVGLTAAISTRLAAAGISANVIAAYYHDHVFVPVADAHRALVVLQQR